MGSGEPIRRLTTIVAADVAGYSRLISVVEEGTLSALRAHRSQHIGPKISEYCGRTANTAGNSILIEFQSVVEADISKAVTPTNLDLQSIANEVGGSQTY